MLRSGIAAAWAGAGLGACSAARFQYESCEDSAQCRAAFGLGWTCGEDGLCAAPVAQPRCESYPEDLLTDGFAQKDDIVLGAIVDRSVGGFELLVRAARLAVKQVNERQGLDGTQFGLVMCSNEANPDFDDLDGIAAVGAVGTYMVEGLGIEGIMGPVTSSQAEAAYAALAPLDTLLVSPSATSPALTAMDGLEASDQDPGLFWRTAPPDDLQGAAGAADVRGLTVIGGVPGVALVDRVAVVHQEGAYGEGLATVFKEQFDDGSHVADLLPFVTSAELAERATAVENQDYPLVMVISSSTSDSSDFLIAAALNGGFTETWIYMTDGAFAVEMLEDASAGDAEALFPNVRGTVPRFYNPASTVYGAFEGAYVIEYNEDPAGFGFTANAYDATWLLIYGSAWSTYQEGRVYGTGMARGLRKLSSGDAIKAGPVDWSNATARFEVGQSFDLEGASGALDYDPVTEETTAPILVWTVSADGEGFDIQCVIDVSQGDDCVPEQD